MNWKLEIKGRTTLGEVVVYEEVISADQAGNLKNSKTSLEALKKAENIVSAERIKAFFNVGTLAQLLEEKRLIRFDCNPIKETVVDETTKRLEEIRDEAQKHDSVAYAKIWEGRRVYVNFKGYDAGFKGDRSLKVYYDIKVGWVLEKGRGALSKAFTDSVYDFAKDYGLDF